MIFIKVKRAFPDDLGDVLLRCGKIINKNEKYKLCVCFGERTIFCGIVESEDK